MTARIAGYVTRKEWGALPPKRTTPLNGRRMEGVALHHGGGSTPSSHSGCASLWRAYQRMHMNDPNDPKVDIAYSYGVCPHGYVFEGRGWKVQPGANGIPWKNGYYPNRTNFAVCAIGSGNVVFSELVTDAIEWCILECRTKGNAADRVRPHSFFASTSCPDTKLRAWAATIDNKPISRATDPGTPGTVRIGDRGSQVVLVQEYLDALGYDVGKVDGVAGAMFDAAVRAFQTRNGLDVDGVAGPNTLTQLRSKEAIMARLSDEDVQRIATAVRNIPIYRPTDPRASESGHVSIAQEIADAKTAAQANTAELAALKAAIAESGKGGPIDLDAIVRASEEGASRALEDLRLVKGDDDGGVRDIEDVDQMTKEA